MILQQRTNSNSTFQQRYGPEFFKRIPAEPGVLWILNKKKGLLLVSSTSNLQIRSLLLREKIIEQGLKQDLEILNEAYFIEWTNCKDIYSAQLIKEQLLKRHSPEYEIHRPKANPFFQLHFQFDPSSLSLVSFPEDLSQPEEDCFGAYKGKSHIINLLGAIGRWMLFVSTRKSALDWPAPFTKYNPNLSLRVDWGASVQFQYEIWDQLLRDFLLGKNEDLIHQLAGYFDKWESQTDSFTCKWLIKDLQYLKKFHISQAIKLDQMHKKFDLKSTYISSEWLENIKIQRYN